MFDEPTGDSTVSRGRRRVLMAATAIALFALPLAVEAESPRQNIAIVIKDSKHDVSPPLRDIPSLPDAGPVRERFHAPLPPNLNRVVPDGTLGLRDPIVQAAPLPGPAFPAPSANFNGYGVSRGDSISVAPPDTVGAAGPNHFLQWVNVSLAAFSKTGTIATGFPKLGNVIWSGFGGMCQTRNDGDPLVRYDTLADRWVISQFTAQSTGPWYQCVAVSTTNDPTGTWYRYAFQWPTGNFPDYGKLGVWSDGYYLGVNEFTNTSASGTFVQGGLGVFDRANMLTGAAATMQYFTVGSSYGSAFPSDLQGFTAPPAGEPNIFFTLSSGKILYWKFHTDWLVPANSSLTGPFDINVAAFTYLCNGGACVPQPGTTTQLDTLSGRLMYSMVYRNFGDHESWILSHSVDPTGLGTSSGQGAPRWYELRDVNGSPTVYQQGTFRPDTTLWRWMPSATMNRFGDVAIGYSVSSSTVNPGIRYAGRSANDTPGTLQAEQTIVSGGGSQTKSFGQALTRWGDYSGAAVDPSDDCRFWYTNEYITANGAFNWSTRIASFDGPTCATCSGAAVPAIPSIISASATAANQVTLTWASVGSGLSYNVYRSANGCSLPYTKIATTAADATSYVDGSVIGGETYGYIISAVNASAAGNCEGFRSSCSTVATYGDCSVAPTFAGVSSVSPVMGGGCGLQVTWSAATSSCPSSPLVSYNVYRSTTSGILGSAIATCVQGTTYNDTSALTAGSTYYYTVRAEDGSVGHGGPCNGGNFETNTLQASQIAGNRVVYLSKDFETGTGLDSWSASGTGSADWRGIQSCSAHSGTKIFRFGGTTCSASYGNNAGNGENGQVATGNIAIAAGTNTTRLSFWHRYSFESGYDGGRLLVSVNGGAATAVTNAQILANGYTGNLAAGVTGCPNPGGGRTAWTGSQASFVNTVVNLDAACGGSCAGKNVNITFEASSDCGTEDIGWFIDDVQVTAISSGSCSAAPPSSLQAFTATATSAQNVLQWLSPSSGSGLQVAIRYRTDSFPTGPTDGNAVPGTPVAITAGNSGGVAHTGLSNGTKVYYSAFVTNGTDYSAGKSVSATPFATSGAVKWAYSTGAASLSAPGGSVGVLSNDRLVHMTISGTTPGGPGTGSGSWPSGWKPVSINNPAQNRPRVVPISIGSASSVMFFGAQDGKVYAVDAAAGGNPLWSSVQYQLGDLIQAGVSGTLSSLGQPYNVLVVGTRNTSGSYLLGLNPTDGARLWSFPASGSTMGIISGAAGIDSTTNNKAYFATRAGTGSYSGTVWCVSFNDTLNATPVLCSGWPSTGVPLGDIDGSPVVFGGRVYVGTNSGTVYALNSTTGATIWSKALGDGPVKGYVYPQFGSNYFYVATTNKVWSLSDSGTATPNVNWSVAINAPSIPLFAGSFSMLYVGSGDGSVHQLSNLSAATPTDTKLTLGGGTSAIGTPALDSGGMLDIGSDDGVIYSISIPF